MEENKDKLINILIITKVAMLIFFMFTLYMDLTEFCLEVKMINKSRFIIYGFGFFLVLIFIIYLFHNFLKRNIQQYYNVFKLQWLLENVFYMIIISLPNYILLEYGNEYKYIFLLLILSCTIQYGSRYGMITSLLSSVTILTNDLLCAPSKNGINMFFQKDIIMAAIFIVIGWVLCYYVDLIAAENEMKDNKLNHLNSKLKEKKKQRAEMKKMIINNEICYDLLFENSTNGVILHEQGNILYANKRAVNLLGYDCIEDFNISSIYELYDKKALNGIKEKYVQMKLEKKLKRTDEEIMIDSFGKSIPVSNTSSIFLYKGKSAVLSVLTDMTNEKEIETLKKDMQRNIKTLNKTKEFNLLIRELFTTMSHELKTPINVIYSAIQVINMGLQDNAIRNIDRDRLYIKSMKQNCHRMIRLINNFVDVTRLQAGEMKIIKGNYDIVETIESIVEKTVKYISGKNIDIIFDTNVEEKIISFDKEAVKRIILNLISNSIKSDTEEILIKLNVTDKHVFIIVKDSGMGIPSDKLDFIFERFAQVDNSLSRKCEGVGLGLFIVKSLVQLHDGKIKMTSKEGEGTKVMIKLPAEIDEGSNYCNKVFLESDEKKIEREFSDIYTI
ncbi:MAG: PAS domain-containing sensor histidine kinase [Clostridium sp.]|nr:PAS domain-containing sensor histidine kinase [Clostridium sp.]